VCYFDPYIEALAEMGQVVRLDGEFLVGAGRHPNAPPTCGLQDAINDGSGSTHGVVITTLSGVR
jgi:hypothetical protein